METPRLEHLQPSPIDAENWAAIGAGAVLLFSIATDVEATGDHSIETIAKHRYFARETDPPRL